MAKEIEKELAPFKPRPLTDEEWVAMMFRPICTHG